jgi:hypothetical protein
MLLAALADCGFLPLLFPASLSSLHALAEVYFLLLDNDDEKTVVQGHCLEGQTLNTQ